MNSRAIELTVFYIGVNRRLSASKFCFAFQRLWSPLFEIVRRAAVGRRLLAPLGHAVVAHDAGNAQAVIGKDAGPALCLRTAVPLELAPALDGLLVAPE